MTWYEAGTFFMVFATITLLFLQILISWLSSRTEKYKLLSSELQVPPAKDIDQQYPTTLPEDHYASQLTFCENLATPEERLNCYKTSRKNSASRAFDLYPNLAKKLGL
jgi:hypothetical protein